MSARSRSTHDPTRPATPPDTQRVAEATLRAAFGEEIPEWVTAGTQKGRPVDVLIARSKHAKMLALGTRGTADSPGSCSDR